METTKPHAELYKVAYWYGMKDAIERALDEFNYRNDSPTKITQDEPNTITVTWGNYVFAVDLLDGVYIGAEEGLEFMYYHHAIVIDGYQGDDDDKPEDAFKRDFAPIGADWYNIRVIDAMLDRAKTFAYIDMISDHVEHSIPQYNDIDGKYLNKNGVGIIEGRFCMAFEYLVGIDPDLDAGKYSIKAYPDYTNQYGVIIHVQLDEFDDKGYVNKDNNEFFLTIDLKTNDAKITPDLPWLMPEDFNANLYTLMPRNPDDDRVLLSAIRIAVDDVIARMHQNVLASAIFSDTKDMNAENGFALSPDVARKFRDKFETELGLVANGSGKQKFTDMNYDAVSFPTGITRVFVGAVVVDIAIDGLGLVDIGVTRHIGKDETWDSIIWGNSLDVETLSDVGYTRTMIPLSKFQGITTYDDAKDDITTESVLRTICNCVQTTLSKMYNR